MAIITRSVTQTLTFTQTTRHNQKIESITQALAFVQFDSARDNHESITQILVFAQALRCSISGSRTISQTLSFTDNAYRNQVGDVYQNFNISQSVSPGNKWPRVDQELNFTQDVSIGLARAGRNALEFTETVSYNSNRVRTLSHQLLFAQATTIYIDRVDYYSEPPPVAVGNDSVSYYVTPPRTVVVQPTVKFQYLNNIPIVIKRPEFQNKDVLELRRIQRESRNCDLIIYRDPAWSATQYLEMQFTFMPDDQTRAVQDFIRGTLGQLVVFTDHENKQWTGMFNSPDLEITTPGRFNNSFTIKFEVIFA